MKPFTGHLLILLCATFLAGSSCKNGGVGAMGANAKKMLPGKWKMAKVTTEPSDSGVSPSDDNSVLVTFREDGTGASAWPSGGTTFKWTISPNDSCIQITDAATTLVNGLYITKMSAGSFTVRDTATHPAQWETFKKQDDK